MDTSVALPFPYYLCVAAVLFLLWKGWQSRWSAWGIPMMAVAATTGIWYLLDPIYNDYGQYVRKVGPQNLTNGLWEILLFLAALGVFIPKLSDRINADLEGRRSQIFQMIRDREIDTPQFQDQIAALMVIILVAWGALMVIALIRVNFDFLGLFFPYLGEKAQPWARDRIGTGFDSLIALAGYLQILLIALMGACFALSTRTSSMLMAGIGYLLASPAILFDRTRSSMLAVLLPGLMALITMRIRGGMLIRIAVLVVSFLAIEGWFKFVIDHRDQGSIAEIFKKGAVDDDELKHRKHLGFNMFEELGFVNYFIEQGTYKVNWGSRYFAELVNPIPRVLWPGKPMIGIDYAIARGMGYGELGAKSAGIAATISTGMIGQGIVNFGRILGPLAAALLMSLWAALLARQDLLGDDVGHLLLYAIGLVLTYNLGRDITLLNVYPFVFGLILLSYMNRNKAPVAATADEA